MGMEVVSQEPLALAPVSAGLDNSLTRGRLAHLVAVQGEVSSTLSLLATLPHSGLLKPPALVLGVGEESSEPRSRHQRACLALQTRVPRSPPEVCSIRPLALDLVLPTAVLAQQEGGLAVTHNKPNLIKEASHSLAQEHLMRLELPLAVQTPPVVAVSLESDKVLLASEEASSSNNSKELQILSGHLATKGSQALLLDSERLPGVNPHKNQEGFSGLRLLALEGLVEAYLPTFKAIMHSSLKREVYLEITIIIHWEAVRFLRKSRRPLGDPFLVSILQIRLLPAGVHSLTRPGLVPITIMPKINKIRAVGFLMAPTSCSSLNYSVPAVQLWGVGYSIPIVIPNNKRLVAQVLGTLLLTLSPAFSQLAIMRPALSKTKHNSRTHYSLRNLKLPVSWILRHMEVHRFLLVCPRRLK